MANTPRIILIAGMPATRKSTYCGWLRAAKGFVLLDVQREREAIDQGIAQAGSLTTFIQGLPRRTVIDWGFPPGSTPAVFLLKEAGVDLWWFDGDPEAARAAYLEQGRGPLDDFDRQMENIREAKPVIENLFGENRITVLDLSGRYMPESVICARMFGEDENTI